MTAPTTHPSPTEYPDYYGRYIAQVPQGNVLDILQQGHDATLALLGGAAARADFRYAPGKWSLKEVVGHVIDAERIFAYRALRFARNDKTPLPGFEQDDYMAYANFSQRELSDLAREFDCVRQASLFLFRNLDAAAWERRGTASTGEFTVRAMAYITAGHEIHHRRIIEAKYL
ncbi:MAG TPA: DinB family protein [Thermoanaerobaculia bacterium]|jgi:hypothetical protein|nr:DinB family protein [Thermoanaerobaculia bacterium]